MITPNLTDSAEATRLLGRAFGSTLRRGDVVGLIGTLGSGKTQFVKGICSAFHVETEVLSPSFVLMHRYEGRDGRGEHIIINHFDFYRIRRYEELEEMGFRELVGEHGVSVIEWADAFPDVMPPGALSVKFEHGDEQNLRSVLVPERKAEIA